MTAARYLFDANGTPTLVGRDTWIEARRREIEAELHAENLRGPTEEEYARRRASTTVVEALRRAQVEWGIPLR